MANPSLIDATVIYGNTASFLASTTTTTFTLNPEIGSGTYLGRGVITRLYYPYVQTKQFPTAWDMGRKTRIGTQMYLLSTTSVGQITLLIFLSHHFHIGHRLLL